MDVRMNAGYIITSSVHVGESEFVLGVSTKAPGQFVTWKCSGGNDYYWGHYFSDQFAAEKDLVARAQEEIEFLEERPQNRNRQKKRSVNDNEYDDTPAAGRRTKVHL